MPIIDLDRIKKNRECLIYLRIIIWFKKYSFQQQIFLLARYIFVVYKTDTYIYTSNTIYFVPSTLRETVRHFSGFSGKCLIKRTNRCSNRLLLPLIPRNFHVHQVCISYYQRPLLFIAK